MAKSFTATVFSSKKTTHSGLLAWAHRGGEQQWPSNTLYAFERALGLGMDALELDIHATRDGFLVVRHDPVVETTTDGRGRISDLTLDEIKALDAGYTWTEDEGRTFPFRGLGITIPTLEEVFQAFPHTPVSIDIKPKDPAVTPIFCQLLRRNDELDKVVVGTFHDDQLCRFRLLCPEVDTAAGVSETRRFALLNLLGLGRLFHSPARAFMIPEYAGRLRLVTPRFIRNAHARGIQVHIWTVDDVEDMRRLIDWGVDGIITDYPSRLIELLEVHLARSR
jgi:glycerophosphoryl diester phosphodiesterase